ncbi:hypothetical protein [Mesoplasma grammopterae]|uniref:hypothetical protein n=1 Tax=Mesoplasma grammopterae TaxID=217215 RepID=UPI0004966B17|nr:hypothetical protein [Mesoplasma grammopterae]
MRRVSIELINKINNYILKQKFSADATLAILTKEISNYDKQIQEHIKKYTLYLIWLDDNKKDSTNAWEKYVARVEVLEAKNNVKAVNEKQTEKLIRDLQDPFSKINQNKQKRSRLNSLSNNLWKRQEEEKPKQIAFEEVLSDEGEILITNIVSETIDNELTEETVEEITEDNTSKTFESESDDASALIDSINRTISNNFDKAEELNFDDELIDLTSTFEELKTSGTVHDSEKTISEIISATLQADKTQILLDDSTHPISYESDNEDLIFEDYDKLPEDEKTLSLFDDKIDDYSTIDILGEIEYSDDEEQLNVLDNSLKTEHDDTFLNTADLNEQNDDSIQTADYNELNGETLSFEEPNKEIRFNSEEDKVHFLHEKAYIKEGVNKPFKNVVSEEKTELVDSTFDQDVIKTEDYEELEEETLAIFEESENTKHDDTFLNTADLNEQNDGSIQTADYNELNGETLSIEEPNKEIRFNSEEDKVHFLHEKAYIKEGVNKPFKNVVSEEKTELADFTFDQDVIKTEDYEELEEMTTASLLGTEEDSLNSFEFDTNNNMSIIDDDEFDSYDEVEELSIKTVNNEEVPHLSESKILYGDIDENFDHEIEKELTQIEETISNLESYTEKVNSDLDELIFSEEERTLFQFEPEDLDVDDTMFENVTLSSGIDQETSTMDALKFLDDVEEKYESLLTLDLDNYNEVSSTMDALKFLDDVEEKYESILNESLKDETLEESETDSTMDALKFLDDVEGKYLDLFKSMDDDELGTIDNLNWHSDDEVDQIDIIKLDHIAKVGEIIDYNNTQYVVVGMSEKTNDLGETIETVLVSENGDIDSSIELIIEIK